jgi:Flp pilus assembly protein TadB
MFKVGTIASLTSAQSLVHNTQKDVNKEDNISQRKKQHSTISTKAQRSSPRGQTTSRNPNFVFFALIFLIFFLILYDLNRKHTNFQLNWTDGVA